MALRIASNTVTTKEIPKRELRGLRLDIIAPKLVKQVTTKEIPKRELRAGSDDLV
jgi:hypothetical protein